MIQYLTKNNVKLINKKLWYLFLIFIYRSFDPKSIQWQDQNGSEKRQRKEVL